MLFLGRPRKFDDPGIFTLKAERALINGARERTGADGKTLNEVINDFLNAYVTPNSPFEKLKAEVKEQRETVAREQTRLMALELRLKQKVGEIPDQYIRYWTKKRGELNQTQRLQFLETAAKKLKLKRDELGTRLDKLADELGVKK